MIEEGKGSSGRKKANDVVGVGGRDDITVGRVNNEIEAARKGGRPEIKEESRVC